MLKERRGRNALFLKRITKRVLTLEKKEIVLIEIGLAFGNGILAKCKLLKKLLIGCAFQNAFSIQNNASRGNLVAITKKENPCVIW